MGLNARLFRAKSLSLMWFFQDKVLAAVFSLLTLAFLVGNVLIFVYDYHRWVRVFQFVVCVMIWACMVGIGVYWRRCGSTRLPRNEAGHAQLLSAPIVAMTLIMGVGSIIGVLHLFYFTSVFVDCDAATGAESRWQIASDFILHTTLLCQFVVYPLFILQSYNRPLPKRWTWLLFLTTASLVVLFSMLSLEEAFHAYVHLCDNSAVLSHHWCPVDIPKHRQFQCGVANFTDVQALWVQLHEQVVGPGAFLVICEFLPLLFALVWMVPVRRDEKTEPRSSIASFYHRRPASREEPHTQLRQRIKSGMNGEKESMVEEADGVPRRTSVVRFRQPLREPEKIPLPPKGVQIASQILAVLAVLAILIRLGLLLNHVGRFPKAELLYETTGHTLLVVILLAQYCLFYFGWLKTFKVTENEATEHHIAHARFDSFLLRIASIFITFHICVSGMAEMNFDDWTGPFFLLHKIPVLASIWLQYVVVARALRLEGSHWKLLRKRTALAITLSFLIVNFMEWVAQFVKRRFTVYVLDSGGPITALITACIAVSELLYPALSFYYFHAMLCWISMLWASLKIPPSKPKEETAPDAAPRPPRAQHRSNVTSFMDALDGDPDQSQSYSTDV